MITTNPSVAEIDATINFLSVLEMAKDSAKLKAALNELKAEQDDLADAQKKHDNAARKANDAAKKAEDAAAKALAAQAKADDDIAKVAKGLADLENERVAMREERNQFDRWMAAERDALSKRQAEVESKAVLNTRAEEEMAKRASAVGAAEAKLANAIAAADAKREEYEAKLASLKEMIN
jgi:chromosome segregation ATPase